LLTAKDQQRVARSKLRQVHLTINELKAKLSAGVQEARDASLAGKEQVRLANDQVQHAGEAYRLSNLRYKEKVPGSSPSEVVQAIISLGSAEANYLMAVNVYDKAQLRLMLLLGAGNCHPPAVEAVVPETVTPAVHKEIVPAAPAAAPVQVAPHGATGARAPALEALRGAEMQYGKK
jgi:outer membrane protein TolC